MIEGASEMILPAALVASARIDDIPLIKVVSIPVGAASLTWDINEEISG